MITRLPQLDRMAHCFAVANYFNLRVYLTGGQWEAGQKVDYYDMRGKRWIEAPPLNHERFLHASVCLGKHLYVFAGNWQGSVESLEIGTEQRWSVISQTRNLSVRRHSAAVVLHNQRLTIFGGYKGIYYLKDSIVFDKDAKSSVCYRGAESDLEFRTETIVQKVADCRYITMGRCQDRSCIHMV